MHRAPKRTAKEKAKRVLRTAKKISQLTLEDIKALKHPQITLKQVIKYGGKEEKRLEGKESKLKRKEPEREERIAGLVREGHSPQKLKELGYNAKDLLPYFADSALERAGFSRKELEEAKRKLSRPGRSY